MKLYKLMSYWLDDKPDDYGRYYRNVCLQGYFTSKEEAEEYINKHWFNFWEHWNNACVIQEWDVNIPIEYQLIKRTYKQWFYLSEEKPNEEIPTLVETPKRMMFNNDRQVTVLGC